MDIHGHHILLCIYIIHFVTYLHLLQRMEIWSFHISVINCLFLSSTIRELPFFVRQLFVIYLIAQFSPLLFCKCIPFSSFSPHFSTSNHELVSFSSLFNLNRSSIVMPCSSSFGKKKHHQFRDAATCFSLSKRITNCLYFMV